MSILNFALQHVALAREEMDEKFERMVKSKSSLTAVRNLASLKTGLREAFEQSMKPVIERVNERFAQMTLKETKVLAYKGILEEEITTALEITGVGLGADSPVASLHSKSAELQKNKHLKDFLEKHSESSHNCFQLRKYRSEECVHCTFQPVRNPELFEKMSFLPEPTPDDSGDHYLPFSQVFGKPLTRDKYRPSARQQADFDEECENSDKQNRDVLKAEKFRDAINCGECNKPRCVFSQSRLQRNQEEVLENIRQSKNYTCGDSLDGEDLVVRRCLNCSSDIEISYFSAKCRRYLEPVCVYCGSYEGLLDDYNEYIAGLYANYSIVRPLCNVCHNSGKEAKTWGTNFAKKRKH